MFRMLFGMIKLLSDADAVSVLYETLRKRREELVK